MYYIHERGTHDLPLESSSRVGWECVDRHGVHRCLVRVEGEPVSAIKTFHCPHCKQTVQARATDVSHRCPAKKNQLVQFKVVEGEG